MDTLTGFVFYMGGRREKDAETILKQVQHRVQHDRAEVVIKGWPILERGPGKGAGNILKPGQYRVLGG